METSTTKLTSRTGLSTSETSPAADAAPPEGGRARCVGFPALGPRLPATPRLSARRFGGPHAQRCGVTSAPRARRTGAKGALGNRPAASAVYGEDCCGSGDCWSGVRYTGGTNVGRVSEFRGQVGEGVTGDAEGSSSPLQDDWSPKPYLPNSSPPPGWRGRKLSLHGPTSCASPCDVTLSDHTATQ